MLKHFNDLRMDMFIWGFFSLSFVPQFGKGLNNVRKPPATPQHSYLNLFQRNLAYRLGKVLFVPCSLTLWLLWTQCIMMLPLCTEEYSCLLLWPWMSCKAHCMFVNYAVLFSLRVRKHLWTILNTWREQCVKPVWKKYEKCVCFQKIPVCGRGWL